MFFKPLHKNIDLLLINVPAVYNNSAQFSLQLPALIHSRFILPEGTDCFKGNPTWTELARKNKGNPKPS